MIRSKPWRPIRCRHVTNSSKIKKKLKLKMGWFVLNRGGQSHAATWQIQEKRKGKGGIRDKPWRPIKWRYMAHERKLKKKLKNKIHIKSTDQWRIATWRSHFSPHCACVQKTASLTGGYWRWAYTLVTADRLLTWRRHIGGGWRSTAVRVRCGDVYALTTDQISFPETWANHQYRWNKITSLPESTNGLQSN